MKEYIKKFDTNSNYQTYIGGDNVSLPNVSYVVDDDEVHYTPYTQIIYKASAKLPETTSTSPGGPGLRINNFDVPITSHTFSNGTGKIEFSGEVTRIGNYAFMNCTGLTTITIPNSVTSIDTLAFDGCTGLTSVTIPDSVTSIGDSALRGCSGLTSIVVGGKNPNYDSRNNCNAIIETASNTLIRGCKNTTIPNGVTSIGGYSFSGCSGLISIAIPNSVTSIADSAFYNCKSLTSITVPNSVTYIGDAAFQQCSVLTSITIPNGVTSIGSSTFAYCSGLTSVIIPDSVTNIGSSAFQNCSSLTSIISNRTTAPSITSSTFRNVKTGGILYVPSDSSGYNTWMGTGNYYLGKYGWTTESSYRIIKYEATAKLAETTNEDDSGLHTNAFTDVNGDTLTITSHTFENGVGTIKFNGDVTGIDYEAFYDCDDLMSITIPSSTITIGDYAFCDCDGITSITIPDSVTSIGDDAFDNCSNLRSITIPESVTSIGDYAFDSCYNLKSITVDSNNTVYDSREGCNAIIETSTNKLIVGCKNTVIHNTVTSIGSSSFRGCSGLTSIMIPNSVTSIGKYAFYSCYNLKSITIPNSVTSIDNGAFHSCTNLASITIPESVTTIGTYVFYGCSSLISINIPENITTIGINTFYNCSSLRSITSNAVIAPSIASTTFQNVKTGGTLYVPSGSTGYDVWIGTGNYYLGKYGWTLEVI